MSSSWHGRPGAHNAADAEAWNCKILQEQRGRRRERWRRKEKEYGEGERWEEARERAEERDTYTRYTIQQFNILTYFSLVTSPNFDWV